MTIDRYLVKHFMPVLTIALSMFVVLVLLIDLFGNLVNYLNHDASFKQIMQVSYYFIPKSVSYALPISLLFAVAYTLGELYARNELTSIISAGIPYWRFGVSLMIIGLSFSVVSFFFEDMLVIPTLREKNQLSRDLKQQATPENSATIGIRTQDGSRLYLVDYYDYYNLTLNGVFIVERGENNEISHMVRSQVATWNGAHWVLNNAVIYQWEDAIIGGEQKQVYKIKNLGETDAYDDSPELFRRSAVDPADLSAKDAKFLVEDLKTVGMPYIAALADYYHRFSFPATSFIVVVLSISMGGRFRKNILLMSLLTSLIVSVVYYVMDMVMMMMARLGYIPPIMGAWFPVVFFMVFGAILVKNSKT
ncbi:MAG: LptF/LptG family permease [Spirochaetaceae bacterium]|jgi:lipopolysaccharide export system permease protein|nr:LptF/LptG family permease [Spirochaetaceae bacterium]